MQARIGAICERERTATHHCAAYRLGRDGEDFRYDDGEPSGTAGPPLSTDSTRGRAETYRRAGVRERGVGRPGRGDRRRALRTPVRLQFAYDDPSPARRVLRQFDTEVQRSEYTDVTTLTVGVRASEVDAFAGAFTNALSDGGELLRVGS